MDCTKASTGHQHSAALQRKPKRRRQAAIKSAKAITPALLAEAILSEQAFAKAPDGALYSYSDGCYRANGESVVQRDAKALLKASKRENDWRTRLSSEVVEYIRVDAPALLERPSISILNVKNGLLDLQTRELMPHSAEYRTTVQLPVIYDPSATCPNTDRFIADVFPADANHLAWEIIAWLMRPDMSLQFSVLLRGDGENGKSVWLKQLREFLGKDNATTMSLHRLEKDKFASQRLLGKLANICADLPTEHLAGSTVFKWITGEDGMTAEKKYGHQFDFDPFARLIFSANAFPKVKHAHKAFFRRWVVIPFDAEIPENKKIPRHELDAMLSNPKELSGVLNRALDALPSIVGKTKFTLPQSCIDAAKDFKSTTDPLAVWLESNTVRRPTAFVPQGELLSAYNAYAESTGKLPVTSMKQLTEEVGNLTDGVVIKQKKICNRVGVRCYMGIGRKGQLSAMEGERGEETD